MPAFRTQLLVVVPDFGKCRTRRQVYKQVDLRTVRTYSEISLSEMLNVFVHVYTYIYLFVYFLVKKQTKLFCYFYLLYKQ